MLKEVACLKLILGIVAGHGYLWDPPGRGTARFRGYTAFPFNYDHMANYCGGYQVQWGQNGGLCGVCGDAYNEPLPRRHEVGGPYGPVSRPVTGTYQSGSVITVGIELTAYHRGFFTFRLCVNNDFSTEVTQDCLNENLLIVNGTGSPYYQINRAPNKVGTGSGYYTIPLQLPAGVVATQAVLQWNYTAGNSWRNWPSQSGCLGCGPQETFINCADIAIVASGTTTTSSTTSTSTTSPTTSSTPTTSPSTTTSTLKTAPIATTSTSTTFPNTTSTSTTIPTTTTSSSTSSPTTPSSSYSTTAMSSTITSTTSPSTTVLITTTSPITTTSTATTSPSTITSLTSSTSTTTSPTASSTQTTSTMSFTTSSTPGCTNTCSNIRNACSCTGAGAYSSIAAMANWCLANCAVGFCPTSHCQCFCY